MDLTEKFSCNGRLILLCLLNLAFVFPSTAKVIIKIGSDVGPPHMIAEGGKASGIDVDVVKHLLAQLNVETRFQFVGLARAKQEVKSGILDAVVPTFIQKDEERFYVSVPIVNYLPTVFSLAQKNMSPIQLHDLAAHSLVSFQGATGYFGPEYQDLANASPYYFEVANMQIIPKLIMKQRFDYAVLDKYIFYYYFRPEHGELRTSVFREHRLIPPAYAGIGFSNKALRDEFNRVAKGFINSKAYKEIVRQYIGQIE